MYFQKHLCGLGEWLRQWSACGTNLTTEFNPQNSWKQLSIEKWAYDPLGRETERGVSLGLPGWSVSWNQWVSHSMRDCVSKSKEEEKTRCWLLTSTLTSVFTYTGTWTHTHPHVHLHIYTHAHTQAYRYTNNLNTKEKNYFYFVTRSVHHVILFWFRGVSDFLLKETEKSFKYILSLSLRENKSTVKRFKVWDKRISLSNNSLLEDCTARH